MSINLSVAPDEKAAVEIVQKKIQGIWENGKKVIISEGKQPVENWEFFDIRELHSTIFSEFTDEESSSFLEALYSEERTKNLEVGDSMSAILMSPDKSRALVYWMKKDGSYIFMNLYSQEDAKANKLWYSEGNSRKLVAKELK
jgi:hypothetical protein